ncbi:uncharacterized protein VTP21DRAFT_2847 [Calcarisporiella thermophila]|uniref:uncharacterized protein n=1 Tax=Calcarisporiella thermophila TaxID=911321 RepID=UPI003742CAFF
MADAFIGLIVKVLLHNGTTLRGMVSRVDQHTQFLTLLDVVVDIPGCRSQSIPTYEVPGSDIKDLNILKEKAVSDTHTPQLHHPQPVSHTLPLYMVDPAIVSYSQNTASENAQQKQSTIEHSKSFSRDLNNTIQTSFPPPPSSLSKTQLTNVGDSDVDVTPKFKTLPGGILPAKTSTIGTPEVLDFERLTDAANKMTLNSGEEETMRNGQDWKLLKKKGRNYQQYKSPASSPAKRSGNRRRQMVYEWGGDVNEFKEEEFDFQGNLDLFDKEKVFAEIRQLDETAPETLLVNLNRNPDRAQILANGVDLHHVTKLAPHENVLEDARVYHKEATTEEDMESDDSWTAPIKKKKHQQQQQQQGAWLKRKAARIRTVSDGVICPVVTAVQMVEVERICATETGPSEAGMIENAGRSAAQMALQALGGSRRIQANNHNAAPLVIVLAGNNKTGAYSLCCARHLANRGVQVVVCLVGRESEWGKTLNYQRRILASTDAKIVHTLAELPRERNTPVDLIIDALLGYQFTSLDLPDDERNRRLVRELIGWANRNKAPVMSLDVPSGANALELEDEDEIEDGDGDEDGACIKAKWTLCLGAPKTGCRGRSMTGEIFLGDIGIPRCCWRKVGVKGWNIPWGAEYVVGLEYE